MTFAHLRRQGPVVLGLWTLLVLTALGAAFEGRWSLSFVACSTLALSFAPLLLAHRLNITLPLPFVMATTLFLMGSVLMGEAFDFYELV
ncbi:MAG: hypothetical protein ACI9TZ_002130, partial [Yoonia sp.]